VTINCYFRTALTSSGTQIDPGALDEIDGDEISQGDVCLVIADFQFSVYYVGSGETESLPNYVVPNYNSGEKVWKIARMNVSGEITMLWEDGDAILWEDGSEILWED